MLLYADDSVLLCTDKNTHNLQRKSETEFHKTEKWIKFNKLSLNYEKTKVVVFFHKMYIDFWVTTQNGTMHEDMLLNISGL